MRQELKNIEGKRRRFSATFCRYGTKRGWKGKELQTLLLKDIKDSMGKIVCDHLWFNMTKEFGSIVLKEGIKIAFDARIKSYYKGYQGHREDVDRPVEKDYRLANPTKVQVVPYSEKYEKEIRTLQETGIWHLLKKEHEVYCGENSPNTIATDDISIVNCPKCLEQYNREIVS